MSFLSILNTCCGEYTGFTYDGHSIQLPYAMGEKNLPSDIRSYLDQLIGSETKTAAEIQSLVDNNKTRTAVDCSGLVYYALNEASLGAVKSYFEAIYPDTELSYSHGVSATNLTSTQYGTQITAAKDIKPGCTIYSISNDTAHVMVVHSVNKNSAGTVTSIVYAHSNSGTGPHHGYITIGDQNKDLNDASQTWNDISYSDSYAKSIYRHATLLDAISNLV